MIGLCECDVCVCDRNARADRGGVIECYDCGRGRHRQAKRDEAPPARPEPYDPIVAARIVARIEEAEEVRRIARKFLR